MRLRCYGEGQVDPEVQVKTYATRFEGDQVVVEYDEQSASEPT